MTTAQLWVTQDLLAQAQTALSGWLPVSGTQPQTAVLAAASAPLAAASQTFASAAQQANAALSGSDLPPDPAVGLQINQIINTTLPQAWPQLSAANSALNSFVTAATQWLNPQAPPPTINLGLVPSAGGDPLPSTAPAAGPGRGGPLSACLTGALAQLYQALTEIINPMSALQQARTLPFTDPTTAYQAVIADLQSVSAALLSASAYAGSSSLSIAIGSAVTAQSTALTSNLAAVADLQTMLTSGAVPSDPAVLAQYLDTIGQLRVFTQPSPLTVPDQAEYQVLIGDLRSATGALLAGSTGASAAPAALLPARLETRLRTEDSGGASLQIRVFVDDIGVDAHDPDLTADEHAAAVVLQAAVRAGDDAAASVWAQTAAAYGAPRTAYLNTVPLPPAGTPGSGPGSTPATGRGQWPSPPVSRVLPDRWLGLAYDSAGGLLAAAVSGPVRRPLQVGPDLRPGAAVPPAPPGGEAPAVEPGLGWLLDYQAALDAGMALTLTLDGGAAPLPDPDPAPAPGPMKVARLVVLGVQAAPAPGAPAPPDLLAATLTAHRFTDGLEILAPGTPTNNVTGQPAGYSSRDPGYSDSFRREVTIPAAWQPPGQVAGDAARLAAALGIDASTFAAAGDVRTDALDSQAVAAVSWHASIATVLPWLGIGDPATLDRVRAWVSAYVTPGGPLPALRIGTQPYGVLPAVSLQNYQDADTSSIAAPVARLVSALLAGWRAAGASALSGDLDSQLARTPVAAGFTARVAVARDPAAPVPSEPAESADVPPPSWLPAGDGLMAFAPSDIDAAEAATASARTQFLQLAGDTSTAAWPAEMVTLPDPAAGPGWPLPDLPGNQPPAAQFLSSLLTGGANPAVVPPQRPDPDTLFTALVNHAWLNTPDAGTAPDAPLQQRGLLPTGQAPASTGVPDQASELRAATSYLSGRSDTAINAAIGGALDALGHRLDAWATAVATSRLASLRQLQPATSPALVLGGYGVVENLVQADPLPGAGLTDAPQVVTDAGNSGFLHAPSLAQATTAAVLRSGYLTNAGSAIPATPTAVVPPAGEAPFAIDLSSRRARVAAWLLEGVRQGQALGALLGYRFERRLTTDKASLIAAFRQLAPLDRAANQNPAAAAGDPALAARATDVADGVTLQAIWLAQQNAQTRSPDPALAPFADPAAQPAFQELTDALDAVTDAITAAALHSTLAGNTAAAAATLASVAAGTVTADPTGFLDTPRTGAAIIQRLLLTVPPATPLPAGWASTPRTAAEPALSSWVAALLPPPDAITVLSGPFVDATGAAVPGADPATVTLGQLSLGPLDFLDLAQRPAELRQLAALQALTQPGVNPAAAAVQAADPAPLGSGAYGEALDIAGCLASALATTRPADGRDLIPPDAAARSTATGVDQADLDARAAAATTALDAAITACAAALPGVPAPGTAPAPATLPTAGGAPALITALQAALRIGVTGAAPASPGTDSPGLTLLAEQAFNAWTELATRRAAAQAAAAALPGAPTAVDTLQAALAQLTAIFGRGFTPVPQQPAVVILTQAAEADTNATPAGQEPLAWLVKIARTRPPIADLLTAITGAEAGGRGELTVTAAQTPAGPWAGGPLPASTDLAALTGTVCFTLLGGPAPANGRAGALVLADWTETIPSGQETTAITYQYDSPAAQAPQTILLAVPAAADAAAWTWADLAAAVTETVDLAYSRAADLGDLASAGVIGRRILPALYVSDNPPAAPAITAQYPGITSGFMAFTPGASVTSVRLNGQSAPAIMQGSGNVTLVVQGTGLTSLNADDISCVPSDGVTIESFAATGTGGNSGVLMVTIGPDAPVSSRGLQAGYGSPSGTLFSVAPRPCASTCDTALIPQKMTEVTVTVTVYGQLLAGAGVVLSGVPAGLITVGQLTSPSSTALTIPLQITASTYRPGPQTEVIVGASGKPIIVHLEARPPQHEPVAATLTITPHGPGAAPPSAFPITIDTLV